MGAVCAQREPAPSQPRGARLPGQAAALRPPGEAHRHGGHGARILLPRHPGGDTEQNYSSPPYAWWRMIIISDRQTRL